MLQGTHPLTMLLAAVIACCVSALCPVPPAAVAGDLKSDERQIGYISIDCGGHRLLFSLDDAVLGECPPDSIPMSPGSYVLRAWQLDDRMFSSGSLALRIHVLAGHETAIDLSLMRWIRVETEPFGALASREGVPLGETPLTVSVLPTDSELVLERDGFCVAVLSAESLLSSPPTRRIVLEPAPGERAPAALDVDEPAGPGRFGKSTYITGLIVIGAAAAAVVLKVRADDEYERYRTTGDLSRMDEHFDRAEKLDTWSVASWVVSEVALGVLLYQILRDREPEVSVEGR